jgi:hypothetical protein
MALRGTIRTAAKRVGLEYETVRKIITENRQKEDHVQSRKVIKRRCKKVVKTALVKYVRNTVHGILLYILPYVYSLPLREIIPLNWRMLKRLYTLRYQRSLPKCGKHIRHVVEVECNYVIIECASAMTDTTLLYVYCGALLSITEHSREAGVLSASTSNAFKPTFHFSVPVDMDSTI